MASVFFLEIVFLNLWYWFWSDSVQWYYALYLSLNFLLNFWLFEIGNTWNVLRLFFIFLFFLFLSFACLSFLFLLLSLCFFSLLFLQFLNVNFGKLFQLFDLFYLCFTIFLVLSFVMLFFRSFISFRSLYFFFSLLLNWLIVIIVLFVLNNKFHGHVSIIFDQERIVIILFSIPDGPNKWILIVVIVRHAVILNESTKN